VHVSVYDTERGGTVTGSWHSFRLAGVERLNIDASQAVFVGNILMSPDNSGDIGRLNASPFRPRSIYVAQSIQAGAPANTAIAAMIHGYAYSAASKVAVLQGRTGQTGNLLECQDIAGAVVASITPSGTITAPTVKLTTGAAVGKIWECNNVDGSGAWADATGAADMVVSNVSTDSGNKYYGGLVGAAWKINRYNLTTFVKTSATISNNPGTPDLATAWTNRLTLVYA
jgi:hypothetical protein